MDINYGDLLDCSTRLLDGFDGESVAIEYHIEEYFLHLDKCLDKSEKIFVKEVFAGCVRYGSILDVVVNGYYRSDGCFVLNSERPLLKVFTYLILFRLDELGIHNFKKCVESQDASKMCKFLNFVLNEKHLMTWMKDEWNKLYDEDFVRSSLLEPLLRCLPRVQRMTQQLMAKIENAKQVKINSAPKQTEPKPFNITMPKPQRIPVPEQIPTIAKPKAVPPTTYAYPTDQQIIDRIKLENRKKAQDLYEWMQENSPSYAQSGKSAKTLQRMQDIVDSEKSKLKFEGAATDGCNYFPAKNESVTIKLNTAAILREELLYRKQEEEQLKRIARLEAGEGDTSKFDEWQSKMRKKDFEKKLEEIEMRRLSGLLSQEESVIARQNLIQQNKERVLDMKIEAQQLMNDFMLQQFLKQEQRKRLIETVVDSHENAKEAKRKMQAYKAKIVQAMNEESRELMRRALEEAEVEMLQRLEIIQEIRTMQALSAARQPKVVDLSETAGYGLMCEMSIAELRERLRLLQVAEQEEEAMRRSQIINDKQAKTQMLLDKMDVISRHRVELTKAADMRAEERRKHQLEKVRPQKPEQPSCALINMEQTLLERRAERRRLEQQQTNLTHEQRRRNTVASATATLCTATTTTKSRTSLLAT